VNSPDDAHYRDVVGRFATGVAVVTAHTDDGPVGFTCQTFGSLSLVPTLVTFSALASGNSWPRVRDAGVVAVNVLAADQGDVARAFATTGADKFAGVAWTRAPDGSPLLTGAIAHFEGRILGVTTHGDHDQVVASVQFAQANPGEPLVYYRGRYTGLSS